MTIRLSPSGAQTTLYVTRNWSAPFFASHKPSDLRGLCLPNIDAERIENFSLNGATQGSGAVNGVVAFAREQCLSGIGQLERDFCCSRRFDKRPS